MFAGGEQARLGTKVWRPLPGTFTEHRVYVLPSEASPILFGLDTIRKLVLLADTPSGCLALSLLPSSLQETSIRQAAFAMQVDTSQSE